MIFEHTSVLLNETMDYLHLRENGIYVDGTLGGAGHALELLKRVNGKARLIGIDQDEDAIKVSTKRLELYASTVSIIRDNYNNFNNILDNLNIDLVDGIYLDLGVSSYQLDNVDRGFTYRHNTLLDMRMDQRNTKTAKYIVNNYSKEELSNIIRIYGEDRFANNIAKHIVAYRQDKEITTTYELRDIIKAAIPMKIQLSNKNPEKRTFQALRIELNQELAVLENSIESMVDRLKPKGILAIITFHSLEDRIVKSLFKKMSNPCTCPSDFPICVCNKKSKGNVLTKKPILPSDDEVLYNSRAKSAKLRVFQKL